MNPPQQPRSGEKDPGGDPWALTFFRPTLRTWLIGTLSAVAIVVFLLTTHKFTGRCRSFDVSTQFAGTSAAMERLDSTSCAGWKSYVAWDFLFIAGYTIASTVMISCGWSRYRVRQLRAATRVILAIPLVVAGCDILENICILLGLHDRSSQLLFRFTFWAWITSVFSWTKWLATAVLLTVLLMSIAMLLRRHIAFERVDPAPIADQPGDGSPYWGLCISGGGIRAAAFGLGALSILEKNDRRSYRWLSAVSGGAYAATAWSLVRASGTKKPETAADDIFQYLIAENAQTNQPNFQYLQNAPGGLARSVGRALIGLLVSLAIMAVFFLLFAWPLGLLVGSQLVHPELHGPGTGTLVDRFVVIPQLWRPGLTFVAAAVVVLVLAAVVGRPRLRLGVVSVLLFAVGVVFVVILVGLPILVAYVGTLLGGGSSGSITALIGGASATAAIATIWRLVSKPALASISKALPRLGGIFLLVADLCWSVWVTVAPATGRSWLSSVWAWAGAAALFTAVYLFLPRIRAAISLQKIYGSSLTGTFGLARDPAGAAAGAAAGGAGGLFIKKRPAEWEDLATTLPELVVCCTQATVNTGNGGFRAESFTISPRQVRWGRSKRGAREEQNKREELQIPTTEYLKRFPDESDKRTVAAWMGVSGAAFASTMGRLSLGTTNALLAAANISLGSWVVNPGFAPQPGSPTQLRRPGLAYLWKEILGWYNDNDAYLYLTDGGHWDNLGLVELLRRGCRYVVCVDASGDAAADRTQTFETLKEAVNLATLELETISDFDISGLSVITGTKERPPATLAASLLAKNSGGETVAQVFYAKAQVSTTMDRDLRIYAAGDRQFPNYSTGDQLLTKAQFADLYQLGRAAATDLDHLIDKEVDSLIPQQRLNPPSFQSRSEDESASRH